ncbi:MAG: DUF6569 family protein [Pyrinomonadaceae bacterium]
MDKRYLLAFVIGMASLVSGIVLVKLTLQGKTSPLPPVVKTGSLSGPFTHKNLTVFLVHGGDTMTGRTPLTLEEAMKRKLVIVHETGDVGELAIENISRHEEVYVQAGDIVKGGKQDRVLAVDLIVPARSGKLPIDSFCVEQGRWTSRGEEPAESFGASSDSVVSKELKLAAKHSKSQTEVWNGVAVAQERLSSAANTSVRSNESRSSLQLSLENQKVRQNAEEFIDALIRITEGQDDVVGFVFAVNGEINSADTYGSSDLFKKLWPKLLKASAIEAISSSYNKKADRSVTADEIQSFMSGAERAPVDSTRSFTDRIRIVTRESRQSVFFETLDQDFWIHRSYIAK